jgi:putative Ca2+/H+ antiporter (TMEM165/GDT1 family)
MDLTVIAITFGAIFVVELPDKTFIAALVLSTRYQPLFVWIGVGLAFLVQTLVAVSLGAVVERFVPQYAVHVFTLVIFLVGAVILFRAAPKADAEEHEAEEEYAARASVARTGLSAIGTSFLVLFAAEWGDLSQLLTINFVTRFNERVEVFIGALAALLTVSGMAVLAGRVLLRYMRLSLLHYIGAAVCLVLAGWTVYELLAP